MGVVGPIAAAPGMGRRSAFMACAALSATRAEKGRRAGLGGDADSCRGDRSRARGGDVGAMAGAREGEGADPDKATGTRIGTGTSDSTVKRRGAIKGGTDAM